MDPAGLTLGVGAIEIDSYGVTDYVTRDSFPNRHFNCPLIDILVACSRGSVKLRDAEAVAHPHFSPDKSYNSLTN
jgi:hypothetical protein